MGVDVSNHWLFVGGSNPGVVRGAAVDVIRQALAGAGLHEVPTEQEALRSIVVAPAGRWLFVGDTAGTTDCADPEAFNALSLALSALGPVVDFNLSDSAVVHIHLSRDGRLVDTFGNGMFPFFPFKDDEQAAPYRGEPEKWADLLATPHRPADLRAVWQCDADAKVVVAETARLLGLHLELVWTGYTCDYDGAPEKYDEFLLDASGVDLRTFEEHHFSRMS